MLHTLAVKLRRAKRQLKENAQRWGWPRSIYISLMLFVGDYLGLHIAWINRRSISENPTMPELATGYTVRQLTEADYAAAAADSDLDMGADFISHALKQGHFCVGAFYEERLVSYVWRAFGDTKITHRFTLKFGKPNRYGYKALTLPEHRGLHLLNTIALYSDKLCFDLGYTYAIGFIETHNFASIRSDARHGNKHVGWILWMDRKPFVFCYTSKGARAIGVTLSRSD